MNERISMMKKLFVFDKIQKKNWFDVDADGVTSYFKEHAFDPLERSAKRLIFMLDNEKPIVYDFEKIAFTRTIKNIPELFTPEEDAALREHYHLHEKGDVSNINVDYSLFLSRGLPGMCSYVQSLVSTSDNEEKIRYWNFQLDILHSLVNLVERYAAVAEKIGNETVKETLCTLLKRAPHTLLEAMQLFRIIHFTMWAGRNYHNTVGRLDQYLYPYFEHDIVSGVLDTESALELLEEFFLSFNRDSDLYPGMQQGDNGQSIVLGGYSAEGEDMYNQLSELCMQASLELRLIDPKINLRVNSKTPIERYVLGTKMTKQGLGFPQYASDDVVVKGLEAWGYESKDALNYVVAACWEFIIPGVAMDIPNLEAFSFATAIRDATVKYLASCHTFEEFLDHVDKEMHDDILTLIASIKPLYIFPAPFVSLMMHDATENAKDISLGAKYNNYGIHGTGIATAVDSLAAISKFVFEKQECTATELIAAIESDFSSNPILGSKLRYCDEKMGNNTELTNKLAAHVLSVFSDSLCGLKNDRGGIFRPGTGSAMYYIWHSIDIGATPDGRRSGEVIPANYSPSLFAKVKGPVSIIKSFASPDLCKVVNGGPLTIEIHDSVFRNEESLDKVAGLIKYYIDLGGHQLQINTVNKDVLLDAQKNPENYRNLIVRVWGWSGYFVELDRCYQDHIINRIELVV